VRSVVQIYLGPPSPGALAKQGAVAQLGERRPCKAEVVGSNPISSTSSLVAGRIGKNRSRSLAEVRLRCAVPFQVDGSADLNDLTAFIDN
jgi:hypothetical protein